MLRTRFFSFIVCMVLTTLLSGCASNKNISPAYDPSLDKYDAQQLLAMGEKSIAKGNPKDAIKYLHSLDVKYPFSPYARQALLDTIYAEYIQDNYGTTILAADRYIRVYPRGPDADYAYYMKALMNMGKGRDPVYRKLGVDPALRDLSHINQAFADFTTIVRFFPDSPYAADSKARLVYLRNLLARHELLIGEFYYSKRAYIGAANRAAQLVEHYQGTPQVEDALVLMVKSYRAIGEDALADNALRMLNLNYPGRKI